MRTTHIRPHTAPASPDRPGTSYSTRSTIRQVEPSPDSVSDVASDRYADNTVPTLEPSFEPFPPFDISRPEDNTAHGQFYAHAPSTDPSTGAEIGIRALRRGGTPSGRTSPNKSRSSSPQKSRSQSPRKHMVCTPTLPAHQESPSSAYSVDAFERWGAPDTPSPIPLEQQSDMYAPLKIHRPSAESRKERAPVTDPGTHSRIADYMRKLQTQQGCGTAITREEEQGSEQGAKPNRRDVAPIPHIIQAMAQPGSPISTQRETLREKEREQVRHTSASRRSETSNTSVASRHSIFSTPGRDEMERKKPIIEEDEGPFAKATNMRDLEQRRRTVSEATRESGGNEGRKRLCGLRCVIM